MNWSPTLTSWQAMLLAMVPVGIVLLYFLKLRREPVEVPSTYLWARTVEDLHVNSLLQRLRRNLLLLLQLLAIAVAAIALYRPWHSGESSEYGRLVFLLDTSASMQATDVNDDANRFERAKRLIGERIDAMGDEDQAMLVTFDDRPTVLQAFTSDLSRLRKALDEAEVTSRSTDILGALKAADGLANPKRSSEVGDVNDVQVADAQPAELLIYTDGGFQPVTEFDLGNLVPEYVGIGTDTPNNIAITAFSAERNVEKPQEFEAFATVANFNWGGNIVQWIRERMAIPDGADYVKDRLASAGLDLDESIGLINAIQRNNVSEVTELLDADLISQSTVDKFTTRATASLFMDGNLIDASEVELVPGSDTGVSFTLESEDAVGLSLELEIDDDFAMDNKAFAGLTPMRTVSVLLVSEGNTPLEVAMKTERAGKICISDVRFPSYLESEEYKKRAEAGVDDLIIFDRCKPETLPATNTFFIGELPSDKWSWESDPGQVVIIDLDRTHPVMRYLELFNLRIFSGKALKGPPGTRELATADIGPVLCLSPRDGFRDLVLGFEIISSGEDGGTLTNTTWYAERSWPTFVLNILRYLAGAAEASGAASFKPGETVRLRVESALTEVEVGPVDGKKEKLETGPSGLVEVIETDSIGNYQVEADGKLTDLFAINLFDHRESDLAIAAAIDLGYEDVAATTKGIDIRREYWRWLLVAMLVLIGCEWWLYVKRIA